MPATHAAYAKGAVGHLFQPKQALIFLNGELDRFPDDDLIAGYVESADLQWHGGTLDPRGGQHGDTAFRLATRTSDPQRRIDLLTRAWTDLHKYSPQARGKFSRFPNSMRMTAPPSKRGSLRF